jgi:sRNA-binding protein
MPDEIPTPAEPNAAELPAEVPAAAEPAAPTVAAAPAAPAVPDLAPAQVAAKLAELFPALFAAGAPKPLKLRIQADIQQRAPGLFTKKSLSMFLHRHTMSTPYLIALTKSPTRFDLDGVAAGDLADEHREAAGVELARRRGLHEVRRAAENAARREAEAQARQAHAADADARRERANLLRAFETTTLTRANFLALKGIAEADFEALLATARTEREQRPPEPRPDRRPPPHEHRGRPNGPREGRDGREQRPDRPRPPQRPQRPPGPQGQNKPR